MRWHMKGNGIRAMHGNDMKAVDAALRKLYFSIGGVNGVRRIAEKNRIDQVRGKPRPSGRRGCQLSLSLETVMQ